MMDVIGPGLIALVMLWVLVSELHARADARGWDLGWIADLFMTACGIGFLVLLILAVRWVWQS